MTPLFWGSLDLALTGQSGHKKAMAFAQFAAGLMALGLICEFRPIFGVNE
jgi:hypothetical protein